MRCVVANQRPVFDRRGASPESIGTVGTDGRIMTYGLKKGECRQGRRGRQPAPLRHVYTEVAAIRKVRGGGATTTTAAKQVYPMHVAVDAPCPSASVPGSVAVSGCERCVVVVKE